MRLNKILKNALLVISAGIILTACATKKEVAVEAPKKEETKTNSKGEGFSAKLWSIDLTGYNERLIKTETDASDPSWSSLLSN